MSSLAALVVSFIVGLVGAALAIRGIVAGRYRPNMVSRIVWTSCTVIGAATAFADGGVAAGVAVGALALGSIMMTAVAMVCDHEWRIDRLDVVCGVAAAVGIVAWQLTGDPALATFAAVTADCLGAVPTVRQAHSAPEREMWQPYALSAVAATAGLVALDRWTIATAGFNVYLIGLCVLLTVLISSGRRRAASTAAAPVVATAGGSRDCTVRA